MKRVLLIEDEVWQADILARQLHDYHVMVARNGQSAIDVIDEAIPDVIILDLLLSGSTGLTVLHELRSHSDLSDIPIIVMTNIADSVTLEQLESYGVTDLLDKTLLKPGDVMRAVEKAIAL